MARTRGRGGFGRARRVAVLALSATFVLVVAAPGIAATPPGNVVRFPRTLKVTVASKSDGGGKDAWDVLAALAAGVTPVASFAVAWWVTRRTLGADVQKQLRDRQLAGASDLASAAHRAIAELRRLNPQRESAIQPSEEELRRAEARVSRARSCLPPVQFLFSGAARDAEPAERGNDLVVQLSEALTALRQYWVAQDPDMEAGFSRALELAQRAYEDFIRAGGMVVRKAP